MASTRLAGHALQSEGKPYMLTEEWSGHPDVRADGPGGYALCECGTSSGWMTSDGQRKRWHADHKEKIRNGG
jgi:CDGSH-type Zn-finger protein